MAKKESVQVNWDMTRAGQARYKDPDYKMFYTSVMNGEKRLKGEVKNVSISSFLKGVKDSYNITDVVRQIQEGRKISILVDDNIHGKKVGIETALACKELGIDKAPCLVCGKSKKEE